MRWPGNWTTFKLLSVVLAQSRLSRELSDSTLSHLWVPKNSSPTIIVLYSIRAVVCHFCSPGTMWRVRPGKKGLLGLRLSTLQARGILNADMREIGSPRRARHDKTLCSTDGTKCGTMGEGISGSCFEIHTLRCWVFPSSTTTKGTRSHQ